MSEAPDQPEVKKKLKLISPLGCLVLVILALIIGSFVSWFANRMMSSTRDSGPRRTQAAMHDIKVAIGHFRTEYNAFPTPSKSEDKDVELRSEAVLIAALLGQDKSLNPREICFVDFPLARDGKFGLLDGRLVDRWGEMYYILMDSDLDNRIAHPEHGADPVWLKKHSPPPHLNNSLAIYSSGPDRDPKTWEDNITSWR